MKLLVDMNLSPRWVDHLAGDGILAVHWAAVGKYDASDAEIMAFAILPDFIVLTHDLDFSAILTASHDHQPSVVQIRADDVSPDTIGGHVVAAVKQYLLNNLGSGGGKVRGGSLLGTLTDQVGQGGDGASA
jgi:predicted nuclease of predicted toxin-antitoxin system